jgi:hypothetical protein
VRPDREPRVVEVGNDAVVQRHRGQRILVGFNGRTFRVLRSEPWALRPESLVQLTRRAHRLLDLPRRAATVVAERVQRADVRERAQLIPVDSCPTDKVVE